MPSALPDRGIEWCARSPTIWRRAGAAQRLSRWLVVLLATWRSRRSTPQALMRASAGEPHRHDAGNPSSAQDTPTANRLAITVLSDEGQPGSRQRWDWCSSCRGAQAHLCRLWHRHPGEQRGREFHRPVPASITGQGQNRALPLINADYTRRSSRSPRLPSWIVWRRRENSVTQYCARRRR